MRSTSGGPTVRRSRRHERRTTAARPCAFGDRCLGDWIEPPGARRGSRAPSHDAGRRCVGLQRSPMPGARLGSRTRYGYGTRPGRRRRGAGGRPRWRRRGDHRPGRLHACRSDQPSLRRFQVGSSTSTRPSCRRSPAPTRSGMPSSTASRSPGRRSISSTRRWMAGRSSPGKCSRSWPMTRRGRCTRGSRPWSIACCRGLSPSSMPRS